MMSLFRNFFFQLNNNIFIFFTDLLIPKKGKLTKNGFVNIKKVIEDNDAIRFINYIETNNISLANNNEDILIPEVEFLSKICFHVNIIEHVKSYLGSDYCLDVVEIIKTSPSNLARSSLWHHDGVGHRLKLYIILKDNLGDNQIKTEYINSSNNIRRLNFSNTKIFTDNSRIKTDKLNYHKSRSKITFFHGELGDAFLFDTNGLHRGFCPVKAEPRYAIQCEYSDRLKGKLVRGQIGQRQNLARLITKHRKYS